MDLPGFLDHLDRYGGDLRVWPERLRADAGHCMAASAQARGALVAMREIEGMLRGMAASAGMGASGVDALAARATRQPQERLPSRIAGLAARTALVAVAVVTLCLGVFVGRDSVQQDYGPDRVLATAFDIVGTVDVD